MPESGPGPGTLLLVVGPSGAGKDSLIDHARHTFAHHPVAIARRVVTRPSTSAEAHDTLTPGDFAVAAAQGRFAFRWQAHGLDYAIPIAVAEWLAAGMTVICNVSRGIVAELRACFPRVLVVYVDAPLAIRRARVVDRRRDGERPDRTTRPNAFTPDEADVVINNGGELAEACDRFAAVIGATLVVAQEPPSTGTEKVTLPGSATE